jgi:membrane-bound lytic murein transglycosylase B
VCEDAAVSIGGGAKTRGLRPLIWTLGVGLAFTMVTLVAVVYSDTILPPQLVIPSLRAPDSAAAVVPAQGDETVQGVSSSGAVDAAWVDRIAQATGIPARALSAYAEAELTVSVSQPGCHLRWNMLAGIGLIESNHGRHGGATLQPDGTSSVPIVGPALDGSNGTKALPATPAGTRWHGDPRWEHAVGPMQFLPSTWLTWGRTLGQRAPDPNNIDDAALTAAAYLCAHGRDLSTAAGWRAAVGSYNAPEAYLTSVTDAANRYARDSLA